MEEIPLNNVEVPQKSVVMQAAKQFAEVFAETLEYQEFEQAYYDYAKDAETQQAIRAFQQKQASLKALLMLNAVSTEDRQELERLQDRFYHQPSVIRYSKAQDTLITLAREVGDCISDSIGLDYGNSCRTGGCCG
ncbi:MAG: YlbF family regulator [Anaerolineaceae bacterium]